MVFFCPLFTSPLLIPEIPLKLNTIWVFSVSFGVRVDDCYLFPVFTPEQPELILQSIEYIQVLLVWEQVCA